jgi:CubicO group peptidase (beta-lactamase class C family)
MTTPANIKELNGAINDKYGLHWWLYPGDRSPVYYARGILGQYIICLPEEKIIIVRTGNKREPLFEVDTDKMIPENMVQLEGHPLDLIMYTKLAFLLDSQLKFQSKR